MALKPIFEKKRKKYRLHFYANGRQYRYGLIRHRQTAERLQLRVHSLIMDYKYHLIAPPKGVPLPDFIFLQAMGQNIPSITPQQNQSFAESPTNQFPSIQLQNIMLSECIDRYLDHLEDLVKRHKKDTSTKDTECVHIRHLRKFMYRYSSSDLAIEDVDLGFFESYCEDRREEVLGRTLNLELGTFRAIFKFAKKKGYIKDNFVEKIEKEDETSLLEEYPDRSFSKILEIEAIGKTPLSIIKRLKRSCHLAPCEIEELLALAEGHWIQPVLKFFASTGIRRGELVRLQWKDVDWNDKSVWVTSKKQSKKKRFVLRQIPINSEIFSILEKQKNEHKSLWVFPGPDDEEIKLSYLRAFEKLVRGTKFEGVGFHALRHSFSSNLVAKNIDQRIIDKLMGHETTAMSDHYRNIPLESKREAVETISFV